MDTNPFIETFIENINNIRNEDFQKNDFKYEEKVIAKKSVNENSMEFKSFKSTTRKKALLDKSKP